MHSYLSPDWAEQHRRASRCTEAEPLRTRSPSQLHIQLAGPRYICSYCHFLNCLGWILFLFLFSWGVDFVDLFSSLVFLDCISPFNICCKAGSVVPNSLNFCLSEKLFISPSILNEILVGYSNLDCRCFPFSTLNISCHFLLVCRVSAERSAVKHMGFLLYVTCCFFLTAVNILFCV